MTEQEFPNEGFNGWGEPEKGMTLRDYFAAHAPAEPWHWFEPNVVPAPTPPEFDPKEDYRSFEYKRQRWQAEDEFWEKYKQRQKYIQWPYYWANEMLKRRGEL